MTYLPAPEGSDDEPVVLGGHRGDYVIFQFLWVWNGLLVALVFLGGREEVEVVTLNLANLANLAGLIGEQGQAWHLLAAGAFITMTVPMIVFFSLQRYFVRGLTAGSVKG